MTARNDSDQLGLDRGVRYNHVSQPRGVRYNHVSQPRGVRYNPELQPLVSQLEDGPQPHAARARRVSVLRPAPSSSRYRWPKPFRIPA